MDRYRPIVDNLSRLVEEMKRANEKTAPLNYSTVDEQCREVIDQYHVKENLFFSSLIDRSNSIRFVGNRTSSESMGSCVQSTLSIVE